ncbi:MAG TPA: gamma-glutamyltransferase [Streptosporangiaceae bacterium]
MPVSSARAVAGRPQLSGTFGMVASTHWLASAAGMAVLEGGGNAFDAAAAAGFVLQVVEPHLNGPGGEVPIIGYSARDEKPFVICGQGPAPRAATIGHFAGLGLDLVPGTGLLPACVPGAFGAWMELLARWGTRSVADVLGYAIGYAQAGHPLLPRAAAAVATVEELFREHWPTSAQVYLRGGGPPAPGALFTNPDLASTYQCVLAEAAAAGSDRLAQIESARRAFYQGFVAEAFASYFAAAEVMDTSGTPHRGLLGFDDMAAFTARVEEPVTLDYHGHTVCKTGPWGQGPVFLQQLALLAGFDLDDTDPAGADFVHTVTECAKLAFADREAWYGDPDFTDVPLGSLLSQRYAAERRRLVDPRASDQLRPGSPGGRAPLLPPLPGAGGPHPAAAASGAGEPTVGLGEPAVADGRVRGDTCHLDVADRFGNLVSATPSGGWLHSSPVVPGLGFGPTTRGQMFWLTEGLPNSLAPGKRPRTTLSPTLVLRAGSPYLACGTPGGDSQDQWTLAFFLHHVHHGLDLQEAIEVPAWHSAHFRSSFYPRESFPARIHAEDRFGQRVLADLAGRGHEVVTDGPWSLGRVCAAARLGDGLLAAAATQRGLQSYAAGR